MLGNPVVSSRMKKEHLLASMLVSGFYLLSLAQGWKISGTLSQPSCRENVLIHLCKASCPSGGLGLAKQGSLQDQSARRNVEGSPPRAVCPSDVPTGRKHWKETRPTAVKQGPPRRSEGDTQKQCSRESAVFALPSLEALRGWSDPEPACHDW